MTVKSKETRKIIVSGKASKHEIVDDTARKNMRYSTSEGVFNSA